MRAVQPPQSDASPSASRCTASCAGCAASAARSAARAAHAIGALLPPLKAARRRSPGADQPLPAPIAHPRPRQRQRRPHAGRRRRPRRPRRRSPTATRRRPVEHAPADPRSTTPTPERPRPVDRAGARSAAAVPGAPSTPQAHGRVAATARASSAVCAGASRATIVVAFTCIVSVGPGLRGRGLGAGRRVGRRRARRRLCGSRRRSPSPLALDVEPGDVAQAPACARRSGARRTASRALSPGPCPSSGRGPRSVLPLAPVDAPLGLDVGRP